MGVGRSQPVLRHDAVFLWKACFAQQLVKFKNGPQSLSLKPEVQPQ